MKELTAYIAKPWIKTLIEAERAMRAIIAKAKQGEVEAEKDRVRLSKIQALMG